MSREIKFRAIPTYKGGFVFGSLIKKRFTGFAEWMIEDVNGLGSDVVNETIGQFTGLYDKNGKEIYEGDIVSDYHETDEGYIKSYCQVFWNENTCQFCVDLSFKNNKSTFEPLWSELRGYSYEVSGNIHENPDLLS